MKKLFLLTSICILLMVYLSCKKNKIKIPYELNGFYEGIGIRSFQNSINGIALFDLIDTINFSITLENSHFEKPGWGTDENCRGILEIEEDEILFTSGECGCLCDCNPLADCLGDFILGGYFYELKNDTLKMWVQAEGIDSTSFPEFQLGFSLSKYVELVKG